MAVKDIIIEIGKGTTYMLSSEPWDDEDIEECDTEDMVIGIEI